MSEEKKAVKLKEDELNKVNGGYKTKTLYTFEMGECYSDQHLIYKVLHYHKDLGINDYADCCIYDAHDWFVNHKKRIENENKKIRVYDLINAKDEGMNFI